MDIQETIDREILESMKDLLWKQIRRFAQKWNLVTIFIAVPSAVKEQLERDFRAAYPELSFEEEWSKCFDECLEEVADRRFEPLVGKMAEAARRFKNDTRREEHEET